MEALMQEQIFYYDFKWFNAWFIFNLLISVLIGYGLLFCPHICVYSQMYVLIGVVIFSWLVWAYKYLYPQKMAVITAESIKIDHTAPLKWTDIKAAEEREVYCCFKKRKIIALLPKDNLDYPYNWLQRQNTGFTPFSVPLYGLLSPQDEQAIADIIEQHVKIKKLS